MTLSFKAKFAFAMLGSLLLIMGILGYIVRCEYETAQQVTTRRVAITKNEHAICANAKLVTPAWLPCTNETALCFYCADKNGIFYPQKVPPCRARNIELCGAALPPL